MFTSPQHRPIQSPEQRIGEQTPPKPHVEEMNAVLGLIDAATLDRLPPKLRLRLEQLLNNPDG